jgi:putative tricarboxylic transport membrane protein
MDKRDTLSSIVWFAVGIFVFISSIRLGIGSFGKPGPGFVSFYASIFFICFTVLMLIMSFIEKKGAAKLSDSWKGLYWGNVLLIIAASIIYLLLMEPLGYLLATFGFMLLLFGLGKMKPWVVLISTTLAVTGSYYLFHILLKVPLPRGIFSF